MKHSMSLLLVLVVGCGETHEPKVARVAAHEEAVVFPSAGLNLEGTLTVPEHAEDESLPAIVLGHGSGPIDRDETVSGQLAIEFGFEIRVFAELATALAQAGYVVLRYDKRSCSAGYGCDNQYPDPSPEIGVDDFIGDVEAALDWLGARPDVDTRRVYFIGHSQGAQFAPTLLASRGDLRAAVMLASPYRPIDVVLGLQAARMRDVLETVGYSEAQVNAELATFDQGLQDLAALRAGTFVGSTIMGDSVSYWQQWLALGDETPQLLAGLDKPILALSGDYDWNVPPAETALWSDAFAEIAQNPGHEAKLLPCVTHVLNCISQPDWSQVDGDDIGEHVDPSVIDAVVSFLDAAHSRR